MWSVMIERSAGLQAEARMLQKHARLLRSRAREARVVRRGGRPLQGGSDGELRSVIDLISGAALCIDCIVRKANISPVHAEEILVKIGRHFRILDVAACAGCLGDTTIYGFAARAEDGSR